MKIYYCLTIIKINSKYHLSLNFNDYIKIVYSLYTFYILHKINSKYHLKETQALWVKMK